jgi:hypothetical protein
MSENLHSAFYAIEPMLIPIKKAGNFLVTIVHSPETQSVIEQMKIVSGNAIRTLYDSSGAKIVTLLSYETYTNIAKKAPDIINSLVRQDPDMSATYE